MGVTVVTEGVMTETGGVALREMEAFAVTVWTRGSYRVVLEGMVELGEDQIGRTVLQDSVLGLVGKGVTTISTTGLEINNYERIIIKHLKSI